MIEAGTCANRYTSVCFASIFRIVVLFYIDADDTTCKSTRKMHRQLLFTSQHTCPIPSHLGLSNTCLLLFFHRYGIPSDPLDTHRALCRHGVQLPALDPRTLPRV